MRNVTGGRQGAIIGGLPRRAERAWYTGKRRLGQVTASDRLCRRIACGLYPFIANLLKDPRGAIAGWIWSSLFTLLGYFFGGIPVVQENFELVIVAILGLVKAKSGKKKSASVTETAKTETTPHTQSDAS
ncbi:DedA membrane protein [Bifidobacterium cuniculi]|uniref:DedA membrane protein n=1 Tax=Bifidobacterium cuniculi TaxID=1688 RepID=A0A087AZP2_9BIFI|nr:DedA membrane protein [Bifidobacterium cuniculi]